MKKIKKKKASLGILSIIGTAAGIATSLAQNAQQRQLAEEQYEREQSLLNQQQALNNMNVLSQEQNNQQYVDQMNSKVTLKCGGKRKIKKATLGTEVQNANSSQHINNINSIGTALSNVVDLSIALSKKPNYTLKYSDGFKAFIPKVIKDPNTPIQPIVPQQPQMINQNPILAQAKLGCKRIKKRNTNRFK